MKLAPYKLLFFLLLVVAAFFLFFSFYPRVNNSACFENKCFDVELALTSQQRVQGLSGRTGLAEGSGLLFVFEEEGVYSFWMKDMLFAIDILWIAGNNTVIFIERNAQPCQEACPSINPGAVAKYVLEVNAGQAAEIQTGDKVELRLTLKG